MFALAKARDEALKQAADSTEPKVEKQRIKSEIKNKYLQNVRAAVARCSKYDNLIRSYKIMNSVNRLSTADIDPNDCHLIGAFNDSTIRLWPLNRSCLRGRKPYSLLSRNPCEWSIEDCDSTSSSSDENDTNEPVASTSTAASSTSRSRKHFRNISDNIKRTVCLKNRLYGCNQETDNIHEIKNERQRKFMRQQCKQNIL